MKSENICQVSIRSLQPSHVNQGCILCQFLRSLCKAMIVTSKLKWRYRDGRDAKTMESLPRKTGPTEQRWPKREDMRGAGGRSGGVKLAKAPPVIPSQSLVPDMVLQDMTFAPPSFSLLVSLCLVLPTLLSARLGILSL